MRKTGKSLLSAGLLFAMILCMVFTVQAASPTAPQIASALQTGNGTVTVTWTKSPEARGYYLEYKVKGTSWKKTKTKDTTLTVGNLVTGKKYKFRVRAYTMTDGKKQYSKYSAVTKVKLSDMSATTTTGNTGNTGTAAQQSDPSRKNLSEALYKNSKAAIICGFDGYGSDIPGRKNRNQARRIRRQHSGRLVPERILALRALGRRVFEEVCDQPLDIVVGFQVDERVIAMALFHVDQVEHFYCITLFLEKIPRVAQELTFVNHFLGQKKGGLQNRPSWCCDTKSVEPEKRESMLPSLNPCWQLKQTA